MTCFRRRDQGKLYPQNRKRPNGRQAIRLRQIQIQNAVQMHALNAGAAQQPKAARFDQPLGRGGRGQTHMIRGPGQIHLIIGDQIRPQRNHIKRQQ